MTSSKHTKELISRQVDKYDGQRIFINNEVVYELNNYLGGGASGMFCEFLVLYCSLYRKPSQVRSIKRSTPIPTPIRNMPLRYYLLLDIKHFQLLW